MSKLNQKQGLKSLVLARGVSGRAGVVGVSSIFPLVLLLSSIISVVVLSAIGCLAQQADVSLPFELVLTLNPAQSVLHFSVDSTLHVVHGIFKVKSGIVHFDPRSGRAGGEIIVIAPSGESGNGSRDKRMHREILETAEYPEIVFHPTQVVGNVEHTGTSDVKLKGMLSIHGAEHEITAMVHAELSGDRWRGTCTFDVPYVRWGIKDPSNFLLKVKPVVNVEFEMSGNIDTSR